MLGLNPPASLSKSITLLSLLLRVYLSLLLPEAATKRVEDCELDFVLSLMPREPIPLPVSKYWQLLSTSVNQNLRAFLPSLSQRRTSLFHGILETIVPICNGDCKLFFSPAISLVSNPGVIFWKSFTLASGSPAPGTHTSPTLKSQDVLNLSKPFNRFTLKRNNPYAYDGLGPPPCNNAPIPALKTENLPFQNPRLSFRPTSHCIAA